MRVAFYARVSTDKQAEKYGIPSQIEALFFDCAGFLCYNVIGC
jgi:DNA invertase Pin-like site-specific DNA recombinase